MDRREFFTSISALAAAVAILQLAVADDTPQTAEELSKWLSRNFIVQYAVEAPYEGTLLFGFGPPQIAPDPVVGYEHCVYAPRVGVTAEALEDRVLTLATAESFLVALVVRDLSSYVAEPKRQMYLRLAPTFSTFKNFETDHTECVLRMRCSVRVDVLRDALGVGKTLDLSESGIDANYPMKQA